MTVIVTPKNKREEKIVKAFLNRISIGFHSEAEEDAALYKAMKEGEKTVLLNEDEKKDFINRMKKAK